MITERGQRLFLLLPLLLLFAAGVSSAGFANEASAQVAPSAPLNVVVTLPEIGEIVGKIGGAEVVVTTLLSGSEDPHFMDATPSLVSRVARADIVCAIGLELESGWLPKALAKSANAKVQNGGAGFCELGPRVEVLGAQSGATDRSMGDVHRSGNPHFNLSPKALAQSSRAVLEVLVRTRPMKAADFEKRQRDFVTEMVRVEKETRDILRPAIEASKLRAVAIEYHKEFAYFFSLYEINSMGSIEEKPGVAPSAGRLAQISLQAKNAGVKVALASLTAPLKHVRRFSELSGIPLKTVPTVMMTSSRENQDATSIEKVQKSIAKAIVESL